MSANITDFKYTYQYATDFMPFSVFVGITFLLGIALGFYTYYFLFREKWKDES